MKELHILNGDALTDTIIAAGFPHYVVMRECLIDGPVNFNSLSALYKARANFLSPENEDEYYNHVVKELDRLEMVSKDISIVLWFEDDLFCQANMWFVLHYLNNLGLTKAVYRVFPKILQNYHRWGGFGRHNENDLIEAYQHKVQLTDADIELGKNLWKAYSTGDFEQLQVLAQTSTQAYHDLPDVVQAHIERFPQAGQQGRPERLLQKIMDRGINNFSDLFREFFSSEGGIYGFGDDQVKNILERMKA